MININTSLCVYEAFLLQFKRFAIVIKSSDTGYRRRGVLLPTSNICLYDRANYPLVTLLRKFTVTIKNSFVRPHLLRVISTLRFIF